MKEYFWLKLLISVAAGAVIITRVYRPDLNIDAITLGLIIVALLPWLSVLIESAKFPGGWEIKFRNVQSAGQKVLEAAPVAGPTAEAPQPTYLDVVNRDPNLALVGLRIEIEKRLRALAERYNLMDERSVMRLFHRLRERGILNDASISGLQELVMAGNSAAHGAKVEPSVAAWAVDYGPQILAALDSKLSG
jgi:hypothetical protein